MFCYYIEGKLGSESRVYRGQLSLKNVDQRLSEIERIKMMMDEIETEEVSNDEAEEESGEKEEDGC